METILYEKEGSKAFITLNRPEKRNALNRQMVEELHESFQMASGDPEIRAVILRANGEVFCAGADLAYLKELQNFSYEENLKDSDRLKELYLKIYQFDRIVIAQVQGHALAGGCGLVTVCDFAFAAKEAKFGYPEVKIGFVPAIVMTFLLRKVGESKCRKMLLSGDTFDSLHAQEYGLVHRIFSSGTLSDEVEKFCDTIVHGNSQESIRRTKEMILRIQDMNFEEALHFSAEMNARARGTEDFQRGVTAFLNKEKIMW